jgi:hypothetical protein
MKKRSKPAVAISFQVGKYTGAGQPINWLGPETTNLITDPGLYSLSDYWFTDVTRNVLFGTSNVNNRRVMQLNQIGTVVNGGPFTEADAVNKRVIIHGTGEQVRIVGYISSSSVTVDRALTVSGQLGTVCHVEEQTLVAGAVISNLYDTQAGAIANLKEYDMTTGLVTVSNTRSVIFPEATVSAVYREIGWAPVDNAGANSRIFGRKVQDYSFEVGDQPYVRVTIKRIVDCNETSHAEVPIRGYAGTATSKYYLEQARFDAKYYSTIGPNGETIPPEETSTFLECKGNAERGLVLSYSEHDLTTRGVDGLLTTIMELRHIEATFDETLNIYSTGSNTVNILKSSGVVQPIQNGTLLDPIVLSNQPIGGGQRLESGLIYFTRGGELYLYDSSEVIRAADPGQQLLANPYKVTVKNALDQTVNISGMLTPGAAGVIYYKPTALGSTLQIIYLNGDTGLVVDHEYYHDTATLRSVTGWGNLAFAIYDDSTMMIFQHENETWPPSPAAVIDPIQLPYNAVMSEVTPYKPSYVDANLLLLYDRVNGYMIHINLSNKQILVSHYVGVKCDFTVRALGDALYLPGMGIYRYSNNGLHEIAAYSIDVSAYYSREFNVSNDEHIILMLPNAVDIDTHVDLMVMGTLNTVSEKFPLYNNNIKSQALLAPDSRTIGQVGFDTSFCHMLTHDGSWGGPIAYNRVGLNGSGGNLLYWRPLVTGVQHYASVTMNSSSFLSVCVNGMIALYSSSTPDPVDPTTKWPTSVWGTGYGGLAKIDERLCLIYTHGQVGIYDVADPNSLGTNQLVKYGYTSIPNIHARNSASRNGLHYHAGTGKAYLVAGNTITRLYVNTVTKQIAIDFTHTLTDPTTLTTFTEVASCISDINGGTLHVAASGKLYNYNISSGLDVAVAPTVLEIDAADCIKAPNGMLLKTTEHQLFELRMSGELAYINQLSATANISASNLGYNTYDTIGVTMFTPNPREAGVVEDVGYIGLHALHRVGLETVNVFDVTTTTENYTAEVMWSMKLNPPIATLNKALYNFTLTTLWQRV